MLQYNSTIAVKLKICEGCGIPSKIFSTKTGKKLCHTCATQNRKPIAKMSDKRVSKMEEEDIQALESELDTVFSRYIRIKYADTRGIVACFTCGCEKHYNYMQNGHFVSRYNHSVRWLEEDCKPQCPGCNENARGNLKVFAERLEQERPGIVEWLEQQGRIPYRLSRSEMKEMLIIYRNKLRIVQSKLSH